MVQDSAQELVQHAPTAAPSPASSSAPKSASDSASASVTSCPSVRTAPRTFVGLSEHMTLDDFADAAAESEYILQAVRKYLCGTQANAEPTLGQALKSGELEIFDVLYTADDMTRASVHVRRQRASAAPKDTTQPPETWRLDVVSVESDWRVASAQRE